MVNFLCVPCLWVERPGRALLLFMTTCLVRGCPGPKAVEPPWAPSCQQSCSERTAVTSPTRLPTVGNIADNRAARPASPGAPRMPKYEQPRELPARLLADDEMISACAKRDFSKIFALAKARGGFYPSLIARRCEMTPSRVGEVLAGRRAIKDIDVIERVADGLRIPGHMLGLSMRDWEAADGSAPVPVPPGAAPMWPSLPAPATDAWAAYPDEDAADEFIVRLIEGQLPQLYESANFFGAHQAIPAAAHYAQNFVGLLERAAGAPRQALLRTGSRVAEFLGWLYQDLGDFESAAYWSDRSMEWAQEATDDHMQAYVLFRKSHQAAARATARQAAGLARQAVGLARAAQRIPGLTPTIKALAIQQEAAAYALQGNPTAALACFDAAHELASDAAGASSDSTLDTSYCTPAYIEIQRASCWIALGEPLRAAQLFENELRALPRVYRNDRGVYLARLARAYVAAGEIDQGAHSASKALAIVGQTGSARTFTELGTVVRAVAARSGSSEVASFTKGYEAVRGRFVQQPRRPGLQR